MKSFDCARLPSKFSFGKNRQVIYNFRSFRTFFGRKPINFDVAVLA